MALKGLTKQRLNQAIYTFWLLCFEIEILFEPFYGFVIPHFQLPNCRSVHNLPYLANNQVLCKYEDRGDLPQEDFFSVYLICMIPNISAAAKNRLRREIYWTVKYNRQYRLQGGMK